MCGVIEGIVSAGRLRCEHLVRKSFVDEGAQVRPSAKVAQN